MENIKSFQELNRCLLSKIDKMVRYRHHIVYISTYIKFKCLPKGFKLRFHSNLKNLEYNNILTNCSNKLMEKTIAYYKNLLKRFEKDARSIATCIIKNFPEKHLYVKNIFQRKCNSLHPILEERRLNKFKRDKIDFEKAKNFCNELLKKFEIFDFTKSTSEPNAPSTQNTTFNQHHPIVIETEENIISNEFKDLCAKGPSFIPTPMNYDWLQLQKDFDRFKNRMRARYMFSKNDIPVDNNSIPPPPKPPSSWTAPKTNSPELETFLSNVERALFKDTSRRKVRENLTNAERKSLLEWRKHQLFNENGELVMRVQDKGNRFVVVNKETDIRKANEQIERSSFTKLNYDPTAEHIEKVKIWAEKWHKNGSITKEWKNYVINENAKPGVNSTLYKTHKPNNPVRLLTSGCNTAIE